MAQHTDFTRPRAVKFASRDPELYELTERERDALDGSEDTGHDHYVTIYYQSWQDGSGTWQQDQESGAEVGPFPTSQLAWLAADLAHPGYSDGDGWTLPRPRARS